LTDQRLSGNDVRVYLLIRSHGSENNPSALPFPGQVRLAEMMGVDRRTIIRAVKSLTATGWITVVKQRRRAGGFRNQYVVHDMPTDAHAVVHGDVTQMSHEPDPLEPDPLEPPSPSPAASERDATFNEVWGWWPKKDGKSAAYRAFRSQMRNYGQSRFEILAGTKCFAESYVASGKKTTYCPMLSKFLGEERWRDWADGPPEGSVGSAGRPGEPSYEELVAAAEAEYEAELYGRGVR
jgi:predicted transcriptional regulator